MNQPEHKAGKAMPLVEFCVSLPVVATLDDKLPWMVVEATTH